MSVKKNLKKILICGASLLMLASVGTGMNNVSAQKIHHARTQRSTKNKSAFDIKNYYAVGQKDGHQYATSFDPEDTIDYAGSNPRGNCPENVIKNTLVHNHLNKQYIKGLYKGIHVSKKSYGMLTDYQEASANLYYDIKDAKNQLRHMKYNHKSHKHIAKHRNHKHFKKSHKHSTKKHRNRK